MEMDYVEREPQQSDHKGKLGFVFLCLAFTVTSIVIACNVNFVGCINTREVEAFCNMESYGDRRWYAEHLGKLINELIELTSKLDFKVCARYPLWKDPDVCYGCAACNGHLSPTDCSSCLTIISEKYANKACKGRFGMNVKVEDCRMRYENYTFDRDSF